MKAIVLDCGEMTTRYRAHACLEARLGLSEYYGKNLDALYDCLTEISTDTLLVLYRVGDMREALGQYAESIINVLEDAAGENPHLNIALDGEEIA